MPSFADPFSGNVDRKMNLQELIRTLRLSLAAEEEATSTYEAQADATDDPLAEKVLRSIADEERIHIGEFQKLISILTKDEDGFLEDGFGEIEDMVKELAAKKVRKTLSKLSNHYYISKEAQARGFYSPWTVYDVPGEGLTPKQMSIIVAKYNALSEFMAHMLKLSPEGLILPGDEALQETQTERDARNARRRELKARLKKQVFRLESDIGGRFEGGFIEDKYGTPLSGNEQKEKRDVFNKFFKDYLDAGIRLVLWQSKGWDPVGNITLYTAEGITHNTVKAEAQAKKEKDRWDEEELREESKEDVYAPTYDGRPIAEPIGPIPIHEAPEYISVLSSDDVNAENVAAYMKRAALILNEFEGNLKRIQKEHPLQSPAKISAMQQLAQQLLEAKHIYNIILRKGFEDLIMSIASKRLNEVDNDLALVGYPSILNR